MAVNDANFPCGTAQLSSDVRIYGSDKKNAKEAIGKLKMSRFLFIMHITSYKSNLLFSSDFSKTFLKPIFSPSSFRNIENYALMNFFLTNINLYHLFWIIVI